MEHILTVVATCLQQGRDVLEYLTACCRALSTEKPIRPCYPLTGRAQTSFEPEYSKDNS